MKTGFIILLTVLFLLSAVLTGGCSTKTLGETAPHLNVRVVVTMDFGQELMLDEVLELPVGTDAMAALQQVARVETAYGGGFVYGINGISSLRTNRDWLIYINGISTNQGALDYTLSDGDIQHWDFRSWRFRMFIPSIIGAFPQPFSGGYEAKIYPTVIVHQDGLENDANRLLDALQGLGVEDITSVNVNELSDSVKQSANLILLITADNELVSELNEAWNRLGFFVHFEDGEMVVYDSKGGVSQRYGAGSGVIQATQNPWNPKGIGICENVVWMLSSIDEAGVRNAADILINRYEELKYTVAAVVVDDRVVRVPP